MAELKINDVYKLLYKLGVTANYTGFFHTAYAVYLAVLQPERMLLVTKWLYTEVAKHDGTTWNAVERNIRTVINTVWETNPEVIEEMAGCDIPCKPSASRFIAILAAQFYAKIPV